MEIEPQPCSHCGADTRQDRAAGLTYCSGCGGDLTARPALAGSNPNDSADVDDIADQTRWRRCFWLAFFLTPVAPVLAGAGAAFLFRTIPGIDTDLSQLLALCSGMGTFAAGVLRSSYCLLRIRNETLSGKEAIVQLIFQSIGMAIISIAILFAGCGVLSVFIR